ncbi:hypothetical protein, partial [Nonomuraea sp. SYSU D8015]|uniref:hypothetical protein n=1 Tax=Nonomuraea sp. SYSU D8015 TaxID=2593644 RepID=UPI001CB7089F
KTVNPMTGCYMCDAHALAFNTLLSSQETDASSGAFVSVFRCVLILSAALAPVKLTGPAGNNSSNLPARRRISEPIFATGESEGIAGNHGTAHTPKSPE